MFVRDVMLAAVETRWLRHPKGESYAYIYTDRSIPPSLREAVYQTHPQRHSLEERLIVYRTRGSGDRGRFEFRTRSQLSWFTEFELVEHTELCAELDTKLAEAGAWYQRDKHAYFAEALPGLWASREALLSDPRAWWVEFDVLGFGSAFGGAVDVPIGLLFELWIEGNLASTHTGCGGLLGHYRGAAGLSLGQKWAACTTCGARVSVPSSGTRVRAALVLCRERLKEIQRETPPASHPYRFDQLVDLYGETPQSWPSSRMEE